MENVVIEEGAVVDRCIIDRKNNIIGKGAVLGEGKNIPNELKPNIL